MHNKTNSNEILRHQILDKCQLKIWEIENEIESLGSLFQVSSSEINGENLYGVGITMEKFSKQLSRINSLISKIY